MKTKQIGNFTQISAESGYIHRKGSDAYFKSAVMLPSDSVDDYEEVDEIPPFTKSEYDAKVAQLVRQKYTDSEEFAIQRKYLNILANPQTISNDNKDVEEYKAYNLFVEECKENAKNPELYKPTDNG